MLTICISKEIARLLRKNEIESTIRSHAGKVVQGTPLVAICEAIAALGFAPNSFIGWLLLIESPVHGVNPGEVECAKR
jgi:hypothetical protein